MLIRDYTSCTLSLFQSAYDFDVSERDGLPKSSVEKNLRDWISVEGTKDELNLANPDVINNIKLIMATISRRDHERLIEVADAADGLVLTFDFIRENDPVVFQVRLSEVEAKDILNDNLPIKKALAITDNRMQGALAEAARPSLENKPHDLPCPLR